MSYGKAGSHDIDDLDVHQEPGEGIIIAVVCNEPKSKRTCMTLTPGGARSLIRKLTKETGRTQAVESAITDDVLEKDAYVEFLLPIGVKRISYDCQVGAAYIHVSDNPQATTVVVTNYCNVDLDKDGQVIGIELLNIK